MMAERIARLKGIIVDYASLVENMIDKSMKGLSKKNRDMLVSVIEEDEPRANNYEIEIEEICVELIAQFEPKAKDLRIVLMVLKMNNDLERMGDHAVNIAQSALSLIEMPEIKPLFDLPELSEETKRMLNNSIDAFINEDTSKAKEVCERDSVVDDLRDRILRKSIDNMIDDPSTIERNMHLIRITKNLERIADLSTNICEDVIYMVKGKVIKHHLENKRDL
ncbi:phosphate signaling complex protein PhoU [candidate division WOR-3 bacterium]|nr:phosphate signaling complex protein PhoU [candidate division WOR-3 bacterium]